MQKNNIDIDSATNQGLNKAASKNFKKSLEEMNESHIRKISEMITAAHDHDFADELESKIMNGEKSTSFENGMKTESVKNVLKHFSEHGISEEEVLTKDMKKGLKENGKLSQSQTDKLLKNIL